MENVILQLEGPLQCDRQHHGDMHRTTMTNINKIFSFAVYKINYYENDKTNQTALF